MDVRLWPVSRYTVICVYGGLVLVPNEGSGFLNKVTGSEKRFLFLSTVKTEMLKSFPRMMHCR